MDILDLSDTSYGIKANVFNAEDKMPNISGAADAVLIRNIKVRGGLLFFWWQSYNV